MAKSFRRLSNRKLRRAYVQAELVNGVAHQIKAMRQQRSWSQHDLAKRLKTSQTVVSRLEDPSYGKFSVNTLLNVGHAFDVALLVRYLPFSEFMLQTWDTSVPRLQAAPYEEDRSAVGFIEAIKPSAYIKLEGASSSSSQQVLTSGIAKLETLPLVTEIGPGTSGVALMRLPWART